MIETEGFSSQTLSAINIFSNDILNGRTNFSQYTLSEHSGVCKAGAPLIGATIVACYARASLEASANAAGSQGSRPNSWLSVTVKTGL